MAFRWLKWKAVILKTLPNCWHLIPIDNPVLLDEDSVSQSSHTARWEFLVLKCPPSSFCLLVFWNWIVGIEKVGQKFSPSWEISDLHFPFLGLCCTQQDLPSPSVKPYNCLKVTHWVWTWENKLLNRLHCHQWDIINRANVPCDMLNLMWNKESQTVTSLTFSLKKVVRWNFKLYDIFICKAWREKCT